MSIWAKILLPTSLLAAGCKAPPVASALRDEASPAQSRFSTMYDNGSQRLSGHLGFMALWTLQPNIYAAVLCAKESGDTAYCSEGQSWVTLDKQDITGRGMLIDMTGAQPRLYELARTAIFDTAPGATATWGITSADDSCFTLSFTAVQEGVSGQRTQWGVQRSNGSCPAQSVQRGRKGPAIADQLAEELSVAKRLAASDAVMVRPGAAGDIRLYMISVAGTAAQPLEGISGYPAITDSEPIAFVVNASQKIQAVFDRGGQFQIVATEDTAKGSIAVSDGTPRYAFKLEGQDHCTRSERIMRVLGSKGLDIVRGPCPANQTTTDARIYINYSADLGERLPQAETLAKLAAMGFERNAAAANVPRPERWQQMIPRANELAAAVMRSTSDNSGGLQTVMDRLQSSP